MDYILILIIIIIIIISIVYYKNINNYKLINIDYIENFDGNCIENENNILVKDIKETNNNCKNISNFAGDISNNKIQDINNKKIQDISNNTFNLMNIIDSKNKIKNLNDEEKKEMEKYKEKLKKIINELAEICKKNKANKKIPNTYMKPFDNACYLSDLSNNDITDFYKNIYKAITINEDKWIVGADMPKYSNYSGINQIGKIKLDMEKVIPVQSNFTFKNSAAYK